MLIVGVNTKLTRRRSESRQADTWWIHLSPVISQLYTAGGHNLRVSTAIVEENPPEGWLTMFRITCKCSVYPVDGITTPPTARLWVADDLLRGTLRLPFQPLLQDWPDVIEGFLSAHDASCADMEASPSLPYLVWKGTR